MFQDRIKKLQAELPQLEIEALLVTSPYNIIYLTGISAFSLEEREAHLLVTNTQCILFTDRRYTGHVKEVAPFVALVEVNSENPFLKALSTTALSQKLERIGFEKDNVSYVEYENFCDDLPKVDFIPTEHIIGELRNIKDATEQANLLKAAQLTDKTFTHIISLLKVGVAEYQIQTEIEYFIKRNAGEIAFKPIVAFGKNSAVPHHSSNETVLQTGDIVLLDFGAKVGSYCSDMTRTVFLGNATDEQKKLYTTTREAQEVAIECLASYKAEGFNLQNVHNAAISHITSLGYPPTPHAIGHGVGLQVHESPVISPFSDEPIEQGMVVTIEPGIYLEGVGGIRIEDTILITPTGVELLNKSSKELTII